MEYKNETKNCQNCKNEFVIEPDDFGFYEKINVPPPTFCPECRMKRRMIWRNIRFLTKGKDAKGNEIFMCIHPKAKIPVYEFSYWNSDNWGALSFGREYIFTKNFFDQFRDLFYSVPFPAKTIQRSINSDYSNNCDDMKNTYLCFNATFLEDCAYCIGASKLKNCFDMSTCYEDELCYESVRVDKSYHTIGSYMCDSCVDVYFSKDCVGCNNCFGCVNLRNSSYKIFNVQYTREEYIKKLETYNLHTWGGFSKAKKEAENFWRKFPIKYMLGFRNHMVSGEDIKDSRNAINCYGVKGAENIKYVQDASFGGASNSYDFTSWGLNVSQLYECLVCGENLYDLKFCYNCYPDCRELEYCIQMRRSKNCFGCVGLRDKQYCVLNKQFSKEEYCSLVEKIKKQMEEIPFIDKKGNIYKYGEFFPSDLSPFAYNETYLNDHFPSNKEEVENIGFNWRDAEKREYATTLDFSELVESIKEADESITKEVIKCSACNKAYRILNSEFSFLKNLNLPLPRKCNNCRFSDRQKFIVPPKFTEAQCMCGGEQSMNFKYKNTRIHDFHRGGECQNFFMTAYDSQKDIIYCEKCYQQEVY